MSFLARLRLFFALIVVVPLVAVAIASWSLVATVEDGKTDARIATALRVAVSEYRDARRQAGAELPGLGADPRLVAALRAGDRQAAAARLRGLVATTPSWWP